jgi:Fe-S-cluster containining protein
MKALVEIEAADRRLLEAVDGDMKEAVRRGGAWIACRPGCTSCCMGEFEITALDALRLRRGLREIGAQRALAIQRRAEQYTGEDEPCPALDPHSGLCALYEWRPMTCRVFGPATAHGGGVAVCELCFQGAGDAQIAAAVVDVDAEGLEEAILEELGGEPTTVAAAINAGA